MKSVEQSDEEAGESAPDRECYRCDRNVAPQFLFTVRAEPPEPLASEYTESERYCCENCAAGMNLSEFSRQVKTNARRGEQPPEE